MATASDPTPTKKRKIKELPLGLAELNKDNFRDKITGRFETDNKEDGEIKVAYQAKLSDGSTVDLSQLTLDQLRKLCRQVGCSYVNKCNKFQCRKAIWILASYQLKIEHDGSTVKIGTDKTTNNIVRITNILFSSDFVDTFLSLNDNKSRLDHELGGLPKDFWADVSEAMNISSDVDDSALKIVLSEEDPRYEELMDLNLRECDLMTASTIKKKVNALLKVRKQIQKNMTISGEHDSDVFNFVEVAMKNIPGKSGLSLLGCYYFFMRCDDNPEIDVVFSTDVDDAIKGNTTVDLTKHDNNSKNEKNNEKKKAYAAMVEISNTAKSIAESMENTNRLAEQNNIIAKQNNVIAPQAQIISVAQALGKNDVLEKLLKEMSSANNNEESDNNK